MSETKTNNSTVSNSFYFAKGFSNGESGYKIRNLFHFGAPVNSHDGSAIEPEMTKDTSITQEMTKDTSITAEMTKDTSITQHGEMTKDTSITSHGEMTKDTSITAEAQRAKLQLLDGGASEPLDSPLIENIFYFAPLRGESINSEMTKDTSITAEMTKDTSITAHGEMTKDTSITGKQGGLFVLEENTYSDPAELPDEPNVNHQHIKAA